MFRECDLCEALEAGSQLRFLLLKEHASPLSPPPPPTRTKRSVRGIHVCSPVSSVYVTRPPWWLQDNEITDDGAQRLAAAVRKCGQDLAKRSGV